MERALEFSDGKNSNFLRIVTDHFSPEEEAFLKEHGYEVTYFNDLNVDGERTRLEVLLINAQGYMDGKEGKIAVIVSRRVREQVPEVTYTQHRWRVHSQYVTSFQD